MEPELGKVCIRRGSEEFCRKTGKEYLGNRRARALVILNWTVKEVISELDLSASG